MISLKGEIANIYLSSLNICFIKLSFMSICSMILFYFPLGMEAFIQSLTTIVLIQMNRSSTTTTSGLQSIFDSKSKLFGLELSSETVLWISIVWSLTSIFKRTMKIIKTKKVVFPIFAKLAIYLGSIAGVLREILSIIIYFTPSLGMPSQKKSIMK